MPAKGPIYLDHNASAPLLPEVIDAMREVLEAGDGNPSSAHALGRHARSLVDAARDEVAALLGVTPEEIVFTSGGTEANNLAILGSTRKLSPGVRAHGGVPQVVTSAVEHPAVIEPCRALAREGCRATFLAVDATGRVRANAVDAAVDADTVLVSIQHANNEVGTIQPVDEIAAFCRTRGVRVHVDAAQSPGKIPVDARALGVDLLSVAGHKLGAPKGVGALYVREGVDLEPVLFGAGHERGRRPGTENVLEIVGLGRAARIARESVPAIGGRLAPLRDLLWRLLAGRLGDRIRRNGHPVRVLPNTLSVSVRELDAGALVRRIGDRLALSAGAACHEGTVSVSSVLRAMGIEDRWAMGTVRLSLGRTTTESEVRRAAEILLEAVS